MKKATQRPNTNQLRYNQQVSEDRRLAAIQRRLDREATGMADVDMVNQLYRV